LSVTIASFTADGRRHQSGIESGSERMRTGLPEDFSDSPQRISFVAGGRARATARDWISRSPSRILRARDSYVSDISGQSELRKI
jgi:hypothetical protein